MTQTRDVCLRRYSPGAACVSSSAALWHSLAVSALGHAAARETLLTRTQHMAAIWTDLFESLLAPPPEPRLRWAGKGPGIGRDAKVAYSGLLGRFVARAHLTQDLGVRVLVRLDVAKDALESVGYSIRTNQADPGYRADWIGCDDRGLVIAEAKGNHSGSIAPQGVQPPPILRPAIRQVTRTEVWGSNEVPARRVAIASRWATQQKLGCDPELLVWDSEPPQTRQPDPALVSVLLGVDGAYILARDGLRSIGESGIDRQSRVPHRRISR